MTLLLPIPSPSEAITARRLIESNFEILRDSERELVRVNADMKDDPDGRKGAVLENRILVAQAIVLRQIKLLTGLSADDLGRLM